MLNFIIALFGLFLIGVGIYLMTFGFDTPPNFLYFFIGLCIAVIGFLLLIISGSNIKYTSQSKRLTFKSSESYSAPRRLTLEKREYYSSKPQKRSKKGIIVILLLILFIGAGAFGFKSNGDNKSFFVDGEHKILVMSADPSEPRPGMGAVDMAFVFTLKDGQLNNITPIYPHKMAHPTESAPLEVQKQGVGKMLLHDSLWYKDNERGAKLAQEIVEYNTGIKTDMVVIFNVESIDAIIRSIGPLRIEGVGYVNGSTLVFLRDLQDNHGYTRGGAVKSLMSAISNATSYDKTKYLTLINTVSDQYNKGNIFVYPPSAFPELISQAKSKGFNVLF
ncbi:MAG: DUF4012 domain-containing protein [Methanobacteriaceae archaeon]|nr:DUF4012 domain-containing protein [Methanobacteriaceae archaeon]